MPPSLLLALLLLLAPLGHALVRPISLNRPYKSTPSVESNLPEEVERPSFDGATASNGKFLWVSDVHFDPLYNPSSVEAQFCRGLSTTQNIAMYGRYSCDAPFSVVESAFYQMYQVEQKPDFIIFSGDSAAHSLPSATDTLNAIRNVTVQIQRVFKTTPVFPCIGNNDVYPDYYLPLNETGAQWLASLWDIWQTVLPASARTTFLKGGYYSVNMGPLRMVVLNSIYYSSRHFPATADPDPAGQFEWLQSELTMARNSKQKVYIMTHIPPSDNSFDDKYLWKQQYADIYYDIFLKFSDVIVTQFYGHLHADDFRLVFDKADKVVGFGMIAPAVSPIFETNPGFKLFTYDTNTLQITDFLTYYFDLYIANSRKNATWRFAYDFREQYKESAVTPATMLDLLNKLKEDTSLFNAWIKFRDSLYVPLRWRYYCAIYYPKESAAYEACVGKGSNSGTS